MSTWTINDQSPEHFGLRVVGGTFRSSRASSVQLSRAVDFDASESFVHGAAVTIKRDGNPFFRGKVRAIDKGGSGRDEGQDYLVEDVWAELELLTYQEPWLIRQSDYQGIAYSPTVVLGMNSAGTRINVGQQIGEVLAFAIDQGLSLQAGTMPTGMMLWPSEVTGMSCAEVIRDCLKYYPDWVPWIDHSTSPPTFKVTPRASATAYSLAVTACSNFRITKTQDRVPEGVKIVYLTASVITVDGVANTYRNMKIDQFPTVPAEELLAAAGPGILVTTVKLAGVNQTITKQKVKTRHIPTSLTDSVLSAKEYLKRKYPQLAEIDDAKFTVSDWERTAILPEDTEPEDIDAKLPRLLAEELSKMPRELVAGNVPESAQRYVGQVRIKFEMVAGSGATEAERKVIERIPTDFIVKGTNATTRKYPVLTSFTPGEDAPTGIAQGFFTTLVNGCYFDGSATLEGEELSSAAWHGSVINLTGGVSEWATMKAPIHSVSWDLSTCETVIDFGPNPEFSFQDFMEFLDLLNKRVNTEYTVEERSGETFGDEDGISSQGEIAGYYDGPETIQLAGGGGASPTCGSFRLQQGAAANELEVTDGTIVGESPAGFTGGKKVFTIATAEGVIYGQITISSTGDATDAQVLQAASVPADTDTTFHRVIGTFTVTGTGEEAVINFSQVSCGPLDATVCRNWYAAEAPFYGLSWL